MGSILDGNGRGLKEGAMRFASISFALLLVPAVALGQHSGVSETAKENCRR